MAPQDRVTVLTTADQVDQFLSDHVVAVVFKAGSCHRTDETLARLEPLLESRADVPFGVVWVVESRPASDRLTQRTGVRHESPQLLVFRAGELLTSRNHWDITGEALAAALAEAEASTAGRRA